MECISKPRISSRIEVLVLVARNKVVYARKWGIERRNVNSYKEVKPLRDMKSLSTRDEQDSVLEMPSRRR